MSILSKLPVNNKVAKIIAAAIAVIIVGSLAYKFSSNNKSKNDEVANLTIDRDMDIDSVEDVEKVIAYWIDNNPEAIIQSVTKMQQQAVQKQLQEAQKNIAKKKDEVYSDKAPSHAPANYDVTIVEFYDYNCGYCKQANKTVQELIRSDKKVRVIYRDFPILGALSKDLSEVSIAVHLTDQSKFKRFHDHLMSNKITSKEQAIVAAGKVGVNTAQLRQVLKTKQAKIESTLQENLILGSQIGISGTPAFVIGEDLAPGALDIDSLKEKIQAQR